MRKLQARALAPISIALLALAVLTFIAFKVAIMSPSGRVAGEAPVVAFPGAEGFGALTVGGRGGRVISVTNLSDAGTGSLRACVEASGPRTCVFRVGGTITLRSMLDVRNPYLTIAGQTAPGGGITLRAANPSSDTHLRIRASQVIVRYIRSRPGTTLENSRALSINNGSSTPAGAVKNVIIDHNSFSWSGDEMTITWLATNHVTYSYNIVSESLGPGFKGPSFGEEGGGYFSIHHNLIANHRQRMPMVSASGGPVDVVNNVIYNPGGIGSVAKNGTHVNYVGNYISSGPDTTLSYYIKDDTGGEKGPAAAIFTEGNFLDGVGSLINTTQHLVATRLDAPALTETTAQAAYHDVLTQAGAYRALACDGSWIDRRDAVDTRVVQGALDRTGRHITSPNWPTLAAGTPCDDSDVDGMADVWEVAQFGHTARGNASASTDDFDGDRYTDLEEFLNGTDPTGGAAPSTTTSPPTPLTTPSLTREAPRIRLDKGET
jgi:pectate lyase